MKVHRVFVKYGDAKSNDLTLRLLRFIRTNLSVFKDIDIRFDVAEYSTVDLQKQSTKQELRSFNVERLPAIVTPNRVYYGADEIISIYVDNIKKYYEATRPEPEPVAPKRKAAPEADENYMSKYFDHVINGGNEEWEENPVDEDIERHVSARFAEESQKRREKGNASSRGPKNKHLALLDIKDETPSVKKKQPPKSPLVSAFQDEEEELPRSGRGVGRPDNLGSTSLNNLFNNDDGGGYDPMGDRDDDLMARYMEVTE